MEGITKAPYLCSMMLDDFHNFIKKENLFEPGDPILLAVSGGLDSTAMIELFHLSHKNFGIAHCNFNLRGEESEKDEQFVRELAVKYRIPVFVTSFLTSDYAKQKGISVQMAARELRYSWFEKIRAQEQYKFIATAHHLDDQIETFFINLLRGAGISGLHGILPKQETIIRPLLFTYRQQLKTFANERKLKFREDSSNKSVKYIRNRIRLRILPLLKEINPEYAHAITETINRVREFEQVGNQVINAKRNQIIKKEKDRYLIEIASLKELSPLRIFAWEFLSPFGFNEVVIDEILACQDHAVGKTFFSPSHRLIKDRMHFIIQPIGKEKKSHVYRIGNFKEKKTIHQPISLSFRKISNQKNLDIPNSKKWASLDYAKLEFPLTLRKWEAGDVFYPFGMNKKKKISHFFIDEKFSLSDKENTWLLCSGRSIIWVVGYRIDQRFRIISRTKEILRVTLAD